MDNCNILIFVVWLIWLTSSKSAVNATASRCVPTTSPVASISGTPLRPADSPLSSAMLAAGPYSLPSASTANWESQAPPSKTALRVSNTAFSHVLSVLLLVLMGATIV